MSIDQLLGCVIAAFGVAGLIGIGLVMYMACAEIKSSAARVSKRRAYVMTVRMQSSKLQSLGFTESAMLIEMYADWYEHNYLP